MDTDSRSACEVLPAHCPFLQSASTAPNYQIPGYCTGLLDDELMVPSLYEYRTFCSTVNHIACPIYRYRRGGASSAQPGTTPAGDAPASARPLPTDAVGGGALGSGVASSLLAGHGGTSSC